MVVFDLDGVLVREPSAWWTLHQAFGSYEASKENLYAYETDKIDYPEFMRRDISLWGRRNTREIEAILLKSTLTEGALETCNILRERGYRLAILSAGIDILDHQVCRKLGVSLWAANGLEIDCEGGLTGEGIFRVDLVNKYQALEQIISPLGFNFIEIVAVGDTQYDIPLMKACGAGVLYLGPNNPQGLEPWMKGWHRVNNLLEFPELLSKIELRKGTGQYAVHDI